MNGQYHITFYRIMIGQIISHYNILEKLGEVPNVRTSMLLRVHEHLIPLSGTPSLGGSGEEAVL